MAFDALIGGVAAEVAVGTTRQALRVQVVVDDARHVLAAGAVRRVGPTRAARLVALLADEAESLLEPASGAVCQALVQ